MQLHHHVQAIVLAMEETDRTSPIKPIYPARLQDTPGLILSPSMPSPPAVVPDDVKPVSGNDRRLRPSTDTVANHAELSVLQSSALASILRLRAGVENLVEADRMRLRSQRHEAFEPVSRVSLSLEEARERLNHVSRKLEEKKENYQRALGEYEHSRGILTAAGEERGELPKPEQGIQINNVEKTCESLLNSWWKNVEIARDGVRAWDYKYRSQTMVVLKVSKELATAQAKYKATCEEIAAEFDDLRSLSIFLMNRRA